MQLSRSQILLETALTYSDISKRAKNEDGCFYLTADNKTCAVGRCMKEPKQSYRGTMHMSGGVWDISIEQNYATRTIIPVDTLLKEEYVGHPQEFWADTQAFHDDDCYWSSSGLTVIGIDRLNYLLKKWSDDVTSTNQEGHDPSN